MNDEMGQRSRLRGLASRAGVVLWLALLWLLLSGQWDLLSLLGGLALGVVVGLLVPLPPIAVRVRPRPVALLAELARLVRDISVSTASLAWAVLSTGPRTRSALITVPLRAEQDALMVLTAGWLTLTPGTVVTAIDPAERELHLHVTPVPRGGPEQVRRRAARTESRLLAALGAGST